MAIFRYLGMTLDGKEVQGDMEAQDLHDVAVHLLAQGLSLEWCKKIKPDEPPDTRPPETDPPSAPRAQTRHERAIAWMRRYSGGAVQSPVHAAIVITFLAAIVAGTAWNIVYHLRPRFPISPPLPTKAKRHHVEHKANSPVY